MVTSSSALLGCTPTTVSIIFLDTPILTATAKPCTPHKDSGPARCKAVRCEQGLLPWEVCLTSAAVYFQRLMSATRDSGKHDPAWSVPWISYKLTASRQTACGRRQVLLPSQGKWGRARGHECCGQAGSTPGLSRRSLGQ